jgi:hypothetical protein
MLQPDAAEYVMNAAFKKFVMLRFSHSITSEMAMNCTADCNFRQDRILFFSAVFRSLQDKYKRSSHRSF